MDWPPHDPSAWESVLQETSLGCYNSIERTSARDTVECRGMLRNFLIVLALTALLLGASAIPIVRGNAFPAFGEWIFTATGQWVTTGLVLA